MESEKIFYSIISAIIIIGGISIGAAYYGAVASTPSKTTAPTAASLTLVITPSGWFDNGTASTDQPAYLMVGPNGTLESTANINLPSHTLITLRLVDYDDYGLEPNIGSTGTSNNTQYAKVTGTVGGVEYVYNSTNINTTLPSQSSTSGINIPTGFAVSQFNWQGNASGGYDEAHTFTILNGSKIMLNIPTPGDSTVVAQFYMNNTGTFNWQCFVPCGAGATGWEGAMVTAGWMTGTVTVS